MKIILLRLSTVMLSLGMLGAAACSGCSQSNTNSTNTSSALGPQSMVCGAGTVRQGNQCVGQTGARTTGSGTGAPAPLTTTGNN
jgi:hypothetical protein